MPTGSHRRLNLLTGEWVVVSPHRSDRPWLGAAEPFAPPASADGCTLCPGATRASGEVNSLYEGPWWFANDFPALALSQVSEPQGLFRAEPADGTCRVLLYGPDHHRPLSQFSQADIEAVIQLWQAHENELFRDHTYVQIFENRGEAMGASNPHPHGQVWATKFLPSLVQREMEHQASHPGELLMEVAAAEIASGERVVALNDDWLVVVPFWAAWPFETLLLPRRSMRRLAEAEPGPLAEILGQLLWAYDRLFECPFPYSMGWHPAPAEASKWQLHAHFYPPLLRSASVRKFMVGFELLAEPQRDLTPEQAAARLRECVR
ncbi:MAG: galactose-1-phosphate uridylyltransferase [Chthonomonas sp.]|nr:galactose-1-phosphate uridylyltransferase [Chthonomonas sp.]